MIKSALQSTIANTQKYRNMNGSYVASSDYKLDEVVVTSPVASVTFDVSPYVGVYKNLHIRMVTRTARASTQDDIIARFNSSSSSYLSHYLEGSGSTPASGNYNFTGAYVASAAGASTTANVFGASVVDILDFGSSSKNTTVRAFFGQSKSDGNAYVYFASTGWFNTAPVTSIQLLSLNSANIAAGSRFSLYGSN